MAQKVQFIATVIHDPEILILDEPFSGFDPVNAEVIKNEMLELKEKGTTVMLSTHRMESVDLLCDHIAMINKSRKVLDGPLAQIKDQSRSNIYKVKLQGTDIALPAKCHHPKEEYGVTSFEVTLENGTPNDLLREVMGLGEVVSFEERIPTIEEIFIQKVKEHAQ